MENLFKPGKIYIFENASFCYAYLLEDVKNLFLPEQEPVVGPINMLFYYNLSAKIIKPNEPFIILEWIPAIIGTTKYIKALYKEQILIFELFPDIILLDLKEI